VLNGVEHGFPISHRALRHPTPNTEPETRYEDEYLQVAQAVTAQSMCRTAKLARNVAVSGSGGVEMSVMVTIDIQCLAVELSAD
jgi:hypothetical protein